MKEEIVSKIVTFSPKYNIKEKCGNCDECAHKKYQLPLVENKKYEVVHVTNNGSYELMGWGSMKFNPDCFHDVVLE